MIIISSIQGLCKIYNITVPGGSREHLPESSSVGGHRGDQIDTAHTADRIAQAPQQLGLRRQHSRLTIDTTHSRSFCEAQICPIAGWQAQDVHHRRMSSGVPSETPSSLATSETGLLLKQSGSDKRRGGFWYVGQDDKLLWSSVPPRVVVQADISPARQATWPRVGRERIDHEKGTLASVERSNSV